MTPPLLVRFTSPTYDVLDNTDPGNPIPLFPPLMNQTYIPGTTTFCRKRRQNRLYQFWWCAAAADLSGTAAGRAGAIGKRLFPGAHCYQPDPVTGKVTSQPTLITRANASAKEIAAAQRPGGSQPVPRRNSADANPPPLTLRNGLTPWPQPNQSQRLPAEVPNPCPGFVADRLTPTSIFSAGAALVAKSPSRRRQEPEISGDNGDGFRVGNGQDIILRETGEAPYVPLNPFEGYNFSEGGPYNYEFDVPGQGTFRINLNENYATGADMLNGIRGNGRFGTAIVATANAAPSFAAH